MTKPQGSATFLKNDGDLLWFSMTCRETGIPASIRLKIKDEVLALDLDNAVTLRLFRFDNDEKANDRRFLKALIVGETDDDEVLDATEISDPYSDKNTAIW